jgi:hypothetical protein
VKPNRLDVPLVVLGLPNASYERDPTRHPFASARLRTRAEGVAKQLRYATGAGWRHCQYSSSRSMGYCLIDLAYARSRRIAAKVIWPTW